MQGNRRAQLFALDLMLAMIPLTIFIGISATAMAGVSTQIQEYIYGYSLQRTAIDATDVLIKTPGTPDNWENDTTTLETLGLASIVDNVTWSQSLDWKKVLVLNESSDSSEVDDSLRYLAGGNNIRLSLYVNTNESEITNLSNENISRFLDIAGFWENGVWLTTNDSVAIEVQIAEGNTLHVQERLAIFGLLPYGLWDISGMENISTWGAGGWSTWPGTFTVDNPSPDNDYYVFIYYISDPPGVTHNFKNLFLNGQEVTSTYSYDSMDPDDQEPYDIDSSDTGLLIPIDYSLFKESNTFAVSIQKRQGILRASLLVVPSGTPTYDVVEYVYLANQFQQKYVSMKVVVWK